MPALLHLRYLSMPPPARRHRPESPQCPIDWTRGGYAPPARLPAASALVARKLHRCASDIAPDAVASSRSASCRLRSEEHTSELQSLMRISYAVFCLKKTQKKTNKQ